MEAIIIVYHINSTIMKLPVAEQRGILYLPLVDASQGGSIFLCDASGEELTLPTGQAGLKPPPACLPTRQAD